MPANTLGIELTSLPIPKQPSMEDKRGITKESNKHYYENKYQEKLRHSLEDRKQPLHKIYL